MSDENISSSLWQLPEAQGKDGPQALQSFCGASFDSRAASIVRRHR